MGGFILGCFFGGAVVFVLMCCTQMGRIKEYEDIYGELKNGYSDLFERYSALSKRYVTLDEAYYELYDKYIELYNESPLKKEENNAKQD